MLDIKHAQVTPIAESEIGELPCQQYDHRAKKVCGEAAKYSAFVASRYLNVLVDLCPEHVLTLELKLTRQHNRTMSQARMASTQDSEKN